MIWRKQTDSKMALKASEYKEVTPVADGSAGIEPGVPACNFQVYIQCMLGTGDQANRQSDVVKDSGKELHVEGSPDTPVNTVKHKKMVKLSL
jgi:hypothetical protein